MKIIWEVGDRVYRPGEFGGQWSTVVELRKFGLVTENEDGERFFVGKNQAEPTAATIAGACRSTT